MLDFSCGIRHPPYPLTENFPKPLLKVGDKTFLDWLVDDIDTAGLVDTYACFNKKHENIFEME